MLSVHQFALSKGLNKSTMVHNGLGDDGRERVERKRVGFGWYHGNRS